MARVLPDTMRPRSGTSAKALLLTVLGELVLPHGGAVWTSTVVRSLGVLGVGERNARQAVARLADQGVVRSEKEGRKARWHLTDQGAHLLTVGTERIYGFGAGDDAWDGRWLVVLCSVPEDQRTRRHQLRAQLGFLGFGFLGAGVALSPHLDREPAATEVLADLRLLAGAVVFRAEAGATVAAGDLLHRAWDLDALAADYGEFLAGFALRDPAPGPAPDRFAALVDLVHAWRRFPFTDPEIPDRLLPSGWPGREAKALFDARHAAWAPDANAWFEAVETAAT
jgi:phenylacetic acid degradation operon negative regulatory protein